MNDLQNFFSNLHVYWQAAIIGIAGGLLGKDAKNASMNNVKGWRRYIAGMGASASSAFTCFVVFLIVHPVTNSDELALGIGGYCAWRGAEWTKSKINELLDRRVSYRGYSYGGDLEGAGIDRRKKYENDEVSEFKNLDESDKGEKVEDTIYK